VALNLSKSDRKARILVASYFAEGILYLAYSVYYTMISPLQYSRAPEGVGFLAIFFFFLMLIAGIYFLVKAISLFRNKEIPSRRDLTAAICSMPLWVLPASVTLGIAVPYLMAPPKEQGDLQPLALYFLQVGIVFSVIGTLNLLSIILVIIQRRKSAKEASHKTQNSKRKTRTRNLRH
jgi:Na+-transporting methylmalonyl-CoA/oxaloacetate decarboxylase gamma subunit